MNGNGKGRSKFAIAQACFRCGAPIVRMQAYSEESEHGGAPVTALVETHWVTAHGALCPECYPWYVSKWKERRMAKEWLS